MASPVNEQYAFGWKDYANNFSHSFSESLEQNELVDVTLVADGHLINAHRLVLSALSPYFRQMFIQMPVNQQAYVFMKDVSRQTLENLITFIYRGKVNVSQNELDDFLHAAKSLKIKGLTDGSYAQSFNFPASNSIWPQSAAHNPFQYQSTRTVQIESSVHTDSVPSNYPRKTSNMFQLQNVSGFDEEYNGSCENGYEMDDNSVDDYYQSSDMRNDDFLINQKYDVQSVELDANRQENDANGIQKKAIVSGPKRMKMANGALDYNIVADIRMNLSGRENLFHGKYKFNKNGNGKIKQLWQCTKNAKCKASASTMDINGVIMMKVLKADHTHEPDQ